MDQLPHLFQNAYTRDFRAADEGFLNGRVASTSKTRTTHWTNWVAYVRPLGVDPFLQNTPHNTRVRCLSGFAARVRRGGFGHGQMVKSDMVSTALSAIGQEVALAYNINPTKLLGSDRFLPRLGQMLDRWWKTDGPVLKKLPVEADIPEFLVKLGLQPLANTKEKAVGDLALIAFYYLLRIGEYTVKGARNDSKQTQQFKVGDVTFFKRDHQGNLRQLPWNASPDLVMSADSATLKLDNQKNGWHGVCIHHESNGDPVHDPVRALGRRVLHIWEHAPGDGTMFLSAFFDGSTRYDVTDKDLRTALKLTATALDYPATRGIPVERIDTHSLRIGGANALSLAGYSDRQIQKMGRWRGETFKEYVREQLSNFSEGMSASMQKTFGFVNVEGGVFHDITETVLTLPYSVAVSAMA